MASTENNSITRNKNFYTKWLLPLFVKPARTTGEIVAQEKPVWLTPLIILSVLAIVMVLIVAPIQRLQIQMGNNLPPDFQYYTPEQQAQFYQAQANQTSFLFLYVFPALSGLLKIWVPWFLLSIVLYLMLTLAGSRASSTRSYNLVAWSMVPFAIRFLVQMGIMLFSKSLITSPGLSGFIDSEATGLAAYFRSMLGYIDIYFIFQVVLLLLGAIQLSGLTKVKTILVTLGSVLILLFLVAIPGLLSSALSGLSLTRGFYF